MSHGFLSCKPCCTQHGTPEAGTHRNFQEGATGCRALQKTCLVPLCWQVLALAQEATASRASGGEDGERAGQLPPAGLASTMFSLLEFKPLQQPLQCAPSSCPAHLAPPWPNPGGAGIRIPDVHQAVMLTACCRTS